jgi:hypothetical protein
MNGFEKYQAREKSASAAIRAVERQAHHRILRETQTTAWLRKTFYELLDTESASIFDGIAKAAQAGRREFNPNSIPECRRAIGAIFDLGGIFDPDLLNDWLYAKDLKHLFSATESSIKL